MKEIHQLNFFIQSSKFVNYRLSFDPRPRTVQRRQPCVNPRWWSFFLILLAITTLSLGRKPSLLSLPRHTDRCCQNNVLSTCSSCYDFTSKVLSEVSKGSASITCSPPRNETSSDVDVRPARDCRCFWLLVESPWHTMQVRN